MKKLKFLKNAMILTFTGFLLRGLGMIFRIYISSRIGEEGMGVYQLISSIYALFITFAQSGLAVTVTRMCAEKIALCNKSESQGVVKSGIKTAVFTGSLAMVVLIVFSRIITDFWIADARAFLSLRVLSFSLPFMAVCSVISGYFTANKNVIHGCSAQIIEQISRLAFAAAAIFMFADKGTDKLLAATFFANTVSEAVSCLYLALRYCTDKKSIPVDKKSYKRKIISSAMPVALSRYLASGLHTAENMLVPTAITLFTGSRADALSQFGALKGMALPLLFFPFSFLNALSTLLVPEITEASAVGSSKRTKSIVSRACFLTLTLSAMIGGVFFVFADNFGMIIYKSERVGMILKVLAPIVPFMYLDSICDGLLKGLGKQKQVLYNNCIDSGIRIILILILVPRFGLLGFLGVMVVSNITVSLLNFSLLIRTSELKNHFFKWWIMPFLWVLVSAIITKFFIPFGATIPKTILGCVFFCLVFGSFVIIFQYKNKKKKIIKKCPLI